MIDTTTVVGPSEIADAGVPPRGRESLGQTRDVLSARDP